MPAVMPNTTKENNEQVVRLPEFLRTKNTLKIIENVYGYTTSFMGVHFFARTTEDLLEKIISYKIEKEARQEKEKEQENNDTEKKSLYNVENKVMNYLENVDTSIDSMLQQDGTYTNYVAVKTKDVYDYSIDTTNYVYDQTMERKNAIVNYSIDKKNMVLNYTIEKKDNIVDYTMEKKNMVMDYTIEKKDSILDYSIEKKNSILDYSYDKKDEIVDYTCKTSKDILVTTRDIVPKVLTKVPLVGGRLNNIVTYIIGENEEKKTIAKEAETLINQIVTPEKEINKKVIKKEEEEEDAVPVVVEQSTEQQQQQQLDTTLLNVPDNLLPRGNNKTNKVKKNKSQMKKIGSNMKKIGNVILDKSPLRKTQNPNSSFDSSSLSPLSTNNADDLESYN